MDKQIIQLSQENERLWDEYILHHPQGTLYHMIGWRNAIEKTFGYHGSYYCLQNIGTITGVLPLFPIKTIFSGKKLISIPFAVYGGILASTKEDHDKLFQYAQQLYREQSANYLEFRYLHNPEYKLPNLNLYVTYIKPIEKSEEEILLSVPKKSRASIRNAKTKFGLEVVIDANVHILYELYLRNKRKLGSPQYPLTFFQNLLDCFKDKSGIITVYYNQIPIASALFLIFRDTILPYFSGSDETYLHTNANNFMYFELMKYALQQGILKFDFGRSRLNTGAGRFKENMGFTAQPLYYYIYTMNGKEIPNISPSNKKFSLVTKIWAKLPLFATRLLGPALVKRIP